MKLLRPSFKLRTLQVLLIMFSISFSACIELEHTIRGPALVKNVDMDQSIQIAHDEMKKKEDMGQSLGIWVLRDQIVTPNQAKLIGDMYLENIDSMRSEFNIWHASWAISNLYRFGDDSVKVVLETAYQKAIIQPERLNGPIKGIANYHINSEDPTTGFIHYGGLFYAYGHLVVPGNSNYVQSYEQYRSREEGN